jgi:hypothetical protein
VETTHVDETGSGWDHVLDYLNNYMCIRKVVFPFFMSNCSTPWLAAGRNLVDMCNPKGYVEVS